MSGPFSEDAPRYRALGLEPRPIPPGAKACKIKGWQKPDGEIASADRDGWLTTNSDQGIGLRLGTDLPGGTKLGALDIDRDDLVRLARALLGPTVERVGAKGAALFFRYVGRLPKKALKRALSGSDVESVGDLLVEKSLCVIPPTIHPSTNRPYRWVGTPLLGFDLAELPVVGRAADLSAAGVSAGRPLELILAALQSHDVATLGIGQQTHEAALGFVNTVLQHTQDTDLICRLVAATLPEDYSGDTLSEVPRMVASGVEKGLHVPGGSIDYTYDAGVEGPIPVGFLPSGDFVLFDQTKRILVPASSNGLINLGTLLSFAPLGFWMSQFPQFRESGGAGVNTVLAGNVLMQTCRRRGGFDQSLVRGRGVYPDPKGGIIVNWGSAIPQDTKFFYVCHRSLEVGAADRVVNPEAVLELLRLFNWVDRSAAMLLFGWAASSVICGALEWRPHVFLTGAKNTGKTTLVRALQRLLDPVAIVLDGQSSEAGIRQMVGADSRPVILDEFESDQNTNRMRQVVKLMRSASSAESRVARGTPEGRALEFSIRSSFLVAAINPMSVTAADRSRIVVLPLNKHLNDKGVAEQIARGLEALQGVGPSWCELVLGQADAILENIRTLKRVFPPCDSRHAQNIATLLGSALGVLAEQQLSEDQARQLLDDHAHLIADLQEAHDGDDALECWNALLEYRDRRASDGVMLGTRLARIKAAHTGSPNARPSFTADEAELAKHGVRWIDGGVVVANSHRGLTEVFADTLWGAGTWGTALKRLEGARPTTQKRFGDTRSLGTWVPADLIPDREPIDGEF